MLRKDPEVKREFVCEESDEKTLMALAWKGNVDELKNYLLAMKAENVVKFFIDPALTRQFLDNFPSKKIAVDFTTAVLSEKKLLMPHVPTDFYALVDLLPEKRQTAGFFSPQPARPTSDVNSKLTPSFSLGK